MRASDLVSQAAVLVLEPRLPDTLELIVGVEDYLIQRRGFRLALFIVLELFPLALPGVAREHTQGVIVECRGEVAWLLARIG